MTSSVYNDQTQALYILIFQPSENNLHEQLDSVGRATFSSAVGRGFSARPCHAKERSTKMVLVSFSHSIL